MRNEELLNTLSECINHCNHCADACLDEENVKMMVKCIRLDRTCATVCAALADVLATSHKDVQGLVDYCERICRQCGEECGRHENEHCQKCAEACRRCAEACRSYAA